MSQALIQASGRLFNALSRHHELIMQVYLNGQVDETQSSTKVLEQLIQLGILWRPDAHSPLRLKSAVRNLLESSLQDERNRTIDANIGAALASLKTLVGHYKEAMHYNRYSEAQSHMSTLTEHVYQLTESLGNSVRIMFSRINNEFGYVASVDAKIRENELAQSQVSDLLQQLECFQFDQLSELAGSQRELRHLLVVALQQSFSRAAQELSVAQARLLDLLGRFREFKGRTRLLKGFLLHCEHHPDFTVNEYPALSQVPTLFNQAAAMLNPAAADVNYVDHEADYHQMATQLTHLGKRPKAETSETVNNELEVTEQSTVALIKGEIQHAVECYFCEVIDSGQACSALDYYQHQNFDFDAEVWIYQVIGGYQALDETDKLFFALDTQGQAHTTFTGNYYIHDVTLGLR